MRSFPARRAPAWFVVLVAVCLAAAARSVAPAFVPHHGAGGHDTAPHLAIWFWVVLVAEAIWKGVEVAGKVALAILQYSVRILWHVATLLGKGAMELAHYAWVGLRQAWHLLRLTYSHVLKPAWKFVWKWIDKTEAWLKRTFEPLVKWLRKAQGWIRDFYRDYLRPVLDVIDISRRALHVLDSLGVGWARTLDAKLGEISDLIQRRYLQVVGELNKVVNIVNRVITADGLFQKLAHVRTIERDIREVSRAFVNWRVRPLDPVAVAETSKRMSTRTMEDVQADTRAALQHDAGPYAAWAIETAATTARYLR